MKAILVILLPALMATAAIVGCGGTDVSDECVGTLDELGQGCPATFDGDLESVPCSATGIRLTRTFSCGNLIVLTHEPDTAIKRCNYDATSHALVGAEFGTDIGPTCDNRFTKTAGRVAPLSCFATGPATQKTCPPR